MQTHPVARFPIDPNPKPSAPETVDRGFADLLADRASPDRADDGARTAREKPGDIRQERAAAPRDDAPVRPERETAAAASDAGDDRPAAHDTAQDDSARAGGENAAGDADGESGGPEGDAAVTADGTEKIPAPAEPAPPTPRTGAPDASTGPTVDGGSTAPATDVSPAPTVAATVAPPTASTAEIPAEIPGEPAAATDTAEPAAAAPTTIPPAQAGSPETAPAEAHAAAAQTADGAIPPEDTNDLPDQTPEAGRTAPAHGADQAPQSDVPLDQLATVQPAAALDQAVATAQLQPAAAKPAGGIRNSGEPADTPRPAAPVSPDITDGDAAADTGESEFRPAATPGQAAKPNAASPDSRPDAGAPGAGQKLDNQAQPPHAVPATPDPVAMVAGPADRTGDAPAQGTNSGQAGHVVSPGTVAGDARPAPGAAPTADAAAQRPPAGAAASQVAIQINRAIQDGQDKLTVNLKPATLGRITVNLELGHDHRVIAVITADRPDTLDLLQRDARTLERALQDAGLKTDSGSLSFNLQGGGTNGSSADDDLPAGRFATFPHAGEEDAPLPAVSNPYARVANASGVDIHV